MQCDESIRSLLAHQLRGPLSCVDGALRLMDSADVRLSPAELQELIAVARSSTERMLALVNRILAEQPDGDSIGESVESPQQAPVRANAKFMQSTERLDTQEIRILMVEDDIDYQRLVRQFLKQSQNPRLLLSQVDSLASFHQEVQARNIDLILLDLTLPDSKGMETVSAVRARCPRIPIIVLTAADEQLGVAAVAHGADDYLVKQQIDCNSLVRSIRYAMTRKRFEESESRLAAIRDFTNTLVHDMMVPLSGENTVLSVLASQESGDLNDQQRSLIKSLLNNNEQQMQLVDKLVEVYSYELDPSAIAFELVPMHEVMAGTLASLRKKFPVESRVSCDLPANLLEVRGNRQALTRLMLNLVHNAFVHGDTSRSIRIHSSCDEKTVSLHIHNWGQPIPEEVQSSAFGSFWQGTPGKTYVVKTGFGLYQSQRIASLHGGRITCRCDEESGTTVTVQLPLVAVETVDN